MSVTLQSTTVDSRRFEFALEDLLNFIFPTEQQHPLAASRLVSFGLYGPLDEKGRLRSGFKGCRIVADYELEAMCLQLEKEDIIQIYLHNPRDMGMLTSEEQEAIVSQADAHLKRAKGKSMLPRLTKKDIIDILADLPRNSEGLISFHEAQNTIAQYRKDRIQQFKLVYPSLVKKEKTPAQTPSSSTTDLNASQTELTTSQQQPETNKTTTARKHRAPRSTRVSESVAPTTMFQRNKGLSNSDLIDQTNQYLSRHAFKLTDIDAPANTSMVYNVRLLREIGPRCKDPYESHAKSGNNNTLTKAGLSSVTNTRAKWDDTAVMGGVGLGSMVQAPASSTTWHRKVTSY